MTGYRGHLNPTRSSRKESEKDGTNHPDRANQVSDWVHHLQVSLHYLLSFDFVYFFALVGVQD